jgi:NAD+ kinase
MKRIGIVLHPARSEAAEAAARLAEAVAARGVQVWMSESDAARTSAPVQTAAELPDDLDLVFVLGGDGTLLRAAETAGRNGAPLLGVNLGRLGFLSELERAELDDGLAAVLDRGFDVEERMVIEGEIGDGADARPVWALNDVIVEKVEIGRSIRLAISIAGEEFVEISSDGLIVATATGSTAYSFSAGGPIVSPRIDCVVVTPVSAHGLFNRSIVVPPDEEVAIRLVDGTDAAALSADGRAAVPLAPGVPVRLRAGGARVRLAKVAPAPFWRLVREKFRLDARASGDGGARRDRGR